MKSFRFLLILGLAVWSGSCHDEGDDSPSRDTADYLTQAVDLNRFFRWTAPAGLSDLRLFIEVDDRTASVPTGFDRAAARQRIEGARDAWKRALREVGVPVESITRFLADSGTSPFSSSACVIRVRFVDRFTGLRIGQTGHNLRSSSRMDFVEIELAANTSTGQRLDAEALFTCALHEFGHALGIACFGNCPNPSHSPNSLDVMFPENVPFTELSGGDRRTIQHLYSLTPQIRRDDA
jgi:hypothetical protein